MTARDDDEIDPEYDITRTPSPSHVRPLPRLSSIPTVFPGCCLGLSAPLLAHLHGILPTTPSLTLSIGSGYGLLEALLLSEPFCLNLYGVEVQPSPNEYLPALRHRTVPGTRFLEPLAASAAAWLFIYPRRVGLIDEYLTAYGDDAVKSIVWIGPMADWNDYKGCFRHGWNIERRNAEEVGGRAWELLVVATKFPS